MSSTLEARRVTPSVNVPGSGAHESHRTLADLIRLVGGIDPARIRLVPPAGTATEADLLSTDAAHCELVERTLVVKAMGFFECFVGSELFAYLSAWARSTDLGIALADGAYARFVSGSVRIPDACYFSWERLGSKQVPREPICNVAPNLAVEIISEGNTKAEMERKRHEYFASGVDLVWIVDPRQQTIEVWTTDRDCHILTIEDILTGGTVLPGFELKITDWFQRAGGGAK